MLSPAGSIVQVSCRQYNLNWIASGHGSERELKGGPVLPEGERENSEKRVEKLGLHCYFRLEYRKYMEQSKG